MGVAPGERAPDAPAEVRAEMAIKAALLDDAAVAAAPVRVQYDGGTIRLMGVVESESERRRAARIARRVVPDLTVINELVVWCVGC